MRRFWLCVFLVTCISAFAASYGSENMKSDAVTSATEYTGIPKKFKNGKAVDEQPAVSTEEKQEPTVALPDENADDESKINSEMRELPETFEEETPTVALPDENIDEESKINSEMRELPETFEEETPTVALPDENADGESNANSEMRELPETFEEEAPTVALPDESADDESNANSEMRELPETFEEETPTVALPDESADDESNANSEMRELPEIFEEETPTVALPDENADGESNANSEMRELPEIFEEETPTVALPDENADGEDSNANSEMRELPLPNALFEEDRENDEELPFIWDEDSKEEKLEQDEFHDEDLPTLLDVPEVTSEKIEQPETFDISDESDKSAELETEIEWVFKKDSRKLMDFNENFDGFPKSDSDVLGNPAEYQYDDENLVVESGRKIDNLTGARLFDSAVKYIKANENSKAAKLLKELLHYNFNVPETEYLLALAEFRSGNADEATKYLKRSFRKNKNPYLLAKNRELLGEINFSQKKYDEAYQNFISAVVGVNAVLDAKLYNKAGIAALRAGDVEKARKAWKTGKYLGSKDAERNLLWLDN